MLKNYLITALRHFLRFKGYTFLNIAGLTVGLATSMLILMWVQDEVSKDKFHQNSERIYKIWRNMHQASGDIITTTAIPQPLELTLENDYPEVDKVTLLSWEMNLLFRKGDKVFRERGRYASPEFLEIFSFPVIVGDPATALNDVYSVVITERLAVKYFGNNWNEENKVLGQTFNISDKEFAVTGVVRTPGSNSSLDFDWLLPAREYIQRNDWVESWFNGGFRMYFTIHEGTDVAALESKMKQEINQNTDYAADERLTLQKYSDTYLHSTFENGVPSGGRIEYVRILFVVAVFILVIACVNFMNLATARSARRTREVGLRKVMGARKGSLSLQFLAESILITLFSVVLAMVVVLLILPYFNNLTGKAIILDFGNPQVWLFLGSITMITGLLAGSYPALLLPSFKVTNSLKGTLKHSASATIFRKGLVIFQFAISILLIIGTAVVYRQTEYIMNKNLGLEKENLLMIRRDGESIERFNSYKTVLLNIPEVKNVTSLRGNPISYGSSTGSADWDGKNPDDVVEINVMSVSSDFFETMDMEIIRGRAFLEESGADSLNYIINEVTAELMGFENPVGQRLSVWGVDGMVIGVVKNFHMDSMYEPIDPLIIRYDPPQGSFIAYIRIQGNIQDALLAVEKVTKNISPDQPFSYGFLDEQFEESYRSEITLSTLANIFAGIAIVISCLGLFGLSSYSAEQRSREIGIRKVHGAAVSQIVLMLSGDYAKLILIAFIVAAPLAFYFMEGWLDNFAFRINLNATLFVFAGIAAFAIGAFTVSFKSIQAALVNPVKTLKDE